MQILLGTTVSFLVHHVDHWPCTARDELAVPREGHPLAYTIKLVASPVMIGDNKLVTEFNLLGRKIIRVVNETICEL